MDHARTRESLDLRTAFGPPATDRAWPFSPAPARRAERPGLERATLDLLAATARDWGLASRAWTRQAG